MNLVKKACSDTQPTSSHPGRPRRRLRIVDTGTDVGWRRPFAWGAETPEWGRSARTAARPRGAAGKVWLDFSMACNAAITEVTVALLLLYILSRVFHETS
jgi:hypothetical protein